ncbi:MAG: hypothetical protein HY288_13650 [Planctomycetia bacterium]|nr:hypothetical protein [Planctomycetia bacterium]
MRRRAMLGLEQLEDRQLLVATAWGNFARDAQHSGQSLVAAQSLDVIHWETPVDSAPEYSGGDLFIHYGSPLVTSANTVIVPEKNEALGGFDLKAVDGATGALKWTQTEGEQFVPPPHDWTPSYSPALAALPGGVRLYFPGPDGTVFYRDSPDGTGAVTPGQIAFYNDNPAAYGNVEISSPLTADSQGNLYFTYRVSGSNPGNLQGGIVRIGADDSVQFADVGTPAMDSAPALNGDGTKLYVAVNGFLVEYNAATLTPMAQVQLGLVHIDSSASPTVGPDGDVFFGVLSPFDHDRGSLEHFSADLSQAYTPGSFGWDDTVSIVPASMIPSYSGPSSYLLMTKYNDYAGVGGTGINKIAIIDPRTDQIDAVTGRLAMATVLSIAGVTPDREFPNKPDSVREWCINNAVVDPSTHSIFANSEDGWLYRWDPTTNTFSQKIQLTSGVGEAYTPTVIGADGTVFAINNAILFAVGQRPAISISGISVERNAGATNAVFAVSLTTSSAETVTVNFATADGTAIAGSDYQSTAGVFTFSPSTTASGGSTVETITVPVYGNAPVEPDEYFFVNLSAATNASIATAQAVGTILTGNPSVVGRFLFYDSSKYDGNFAGANASDDNAVATDKFAYLPGAGPATFANVSSYDKGINGIMVDLRGAGTHGSIGLGDFAFKVGNNNSANIWATGPGPATVTVRSGAGVSGSDRVELIWADGAIQQKWLEVAVKATANTGLAANDHFFFGSEIGDTGSSNTATVAKVTSLDVTGVQTHGASLKTNIPLTNVYDFNRDGLVNSFDVTDAQTHGTSNKTGLQLINISAAGPLAQVSAEVPAPSGDRVASALAGTSTSTTTPTISHWIVNRFSHIDANHGPIAKPFDHLADEHTVKSLEILVETDRSADTGDLDGELLDRLIRGL